MLEPLHADRSAYGVLQTSIFVQKVSGVASIDEEEHPEIAAQQVTYKQPDKQTGVETVVFDWVIKHARRFSA